MTSTNHYTFLFGSQDLEISSESLNTLRQTILSAPDFQWLVDTLSTLPETWDTVSESHSLIAKDFNCSEQLQHLLHWLRRGEYNGSFPPSNIVATPLVVVTQLAQFEAFARRQAVTSTNDALSAILKATISSSGLCTGLLSAAAVASSRTLEDLHTNGAVAIRLAMLIGAFVDARDDPRWSSLAVGWTAEDGAARVRELIKSVPNAYIAVTAEARQLTITIPQTNAASLARTLKDAGYNVIETALRGAFHQTSHRDEVTSFLSAVDASGKDFQFAELVHTLIPANPLQTIQDNPSSHAVTRAMLCDPAEWHSLYDYIESSSSKLDSTVVTFGRKRCIPHSIAIKLGNLINAAELKSENDSLQRSEDIAIIGMACNVPGGGDLVEFWDTLCTGQSQHAELPLDRISFTGPWRKDDDSRKWFGNLINHPDAFDHRFFKRTPVEMASTDPQQRLIHQVAYQALEQSGYFSDPVPEKHVACYIGIGPCDYEGNVANHPATAYTATGNLRSFAAGKISHYFGWVAPGITIDTACSSSAVAIHEACKAIITGECTTALAGGTNVLTGPEWFQNLAGASFLSLTGQCKPFDASADGYCRSEGAGAVYLKKLADAERDGNQILGIIKSTFVAQNENCSAITAPTARSLADGFRTVVQRAGLQPKHISLVEAHGTGTQVGDKAEYSAVREVFAEDARSSPLSLGSVKGHIGHLESASGVASVIKVALMMHHKVIPPQASHKSFNPKLLSTPAIDDKIKIMTDRTRWQDDTKIAMINNYGASGSNASIILAQSPHLKSTKVAANMELPFWLSAAQPKSLRSYATKLAQFIRRRSALGRDAKLTDLSFQLTLQSNRSLDSAFIFSSKSPGDLLQKLDALSNGEMDKTIISTNEFKARPVILAFGGQVGNSVTINQELYDNIEILRTHMDRCNEICISLGHDAIIPAIFDSAPADNIINLQLALFTMQYSSAQCWIDSGVKVDAVVGHSFGELAALCISGSLSLKDAITMVAGRAATIQSKWGSDSGSMMFIEGEQSQIKDLLTSSNCGASIACYNGPRSFTLAGTTAEIDSLQEFLANSPMHNTLRSKRLSVTNAFHSKLVDPLMSDLNAIGEKLIWRTPVIHQERATLNASPNTTPAGDFVASHMREPVYFANAVQRLAEKYPSAVWLEAGSGSGITTMASKALNSSTALFQSLNLSNAENLTQTTTNLWKSGLNFKYWGHHKTQSNEYAPLLLPSYQFEKSSHWLSRKELPTAPTVAAPATSIATAEVQGLWTFGGYQKSSRGQRCQAQFRINTASNEFQTHVSAHVIASAVPICPSGFQYRIASEAITSLMTDKQQLQCELQNMVNHAAIVITSDREITLTASRNDDNSLLWDWNISSNVVGADKPTLHVNGQVNFIEDGGDQMFSRYGRLISHATCKTLLNDPDAESIQGQRNIYKIFSPVVHYNEEGYKGLRRIAAKGNESAGRISVPVDSETALKVGLSDSFCQVAGIFANCMSDCKDDEMYLSNKLEHWICPSPLNLDAGTAYEVYARHDRPSDKEWLSDIFVFTPSDGKLVAAIFGMGFIKLSISGMGRMLRRLSGIKESSKNEVKEISNETVPVSVPVKSAIGEPTPPETPPSEPVTTISSTKPTKAKSSALSGIETKLRGVLCDILGLDDEDIKPKSDLIDLGVDSLLAMELARDVQRVCDVVLDTAALMALTDFKSLIESVVARSDLDADATDEPDETSETTPEFVDSGLGTPELVKQDVPSQQGVSSPKGLRIDMDVLIEAFERTKALTDGIIKANKLDGFSYEVLPQQNELVVVHIIDAFEKLGSNLRSASSGDVLDRVVCMPRHKQEIDIFYDLLQAARIVETKNDKIIRTSIPITDKSASTLLEELLQSPSHLDYDHKLTSLVGNQLAECLTGEVEAIQMIFGSAENRALVSASYAQSPIHSTMINQLVSFLQILFSKIDHSNGPVKILELGAGTGGTTSSLLPIIAASGVPVEYTISDISSGLVAGLRKRFAKQYPFTKFTVVDMENAPPTEWIESQHAIFATNCVHATKNLKVTTGNIHKMLKPDGFLVMIEMTQVLPWVDLVFGLTEGWWAFNDGRTHACIKPSEWETIFRSNGYGYVDWTEGQLPESRIQQLIIAAACSESRYRVTMPTSPKRPDLLTDTSARQRSIDRLVQEHTQGFSAPKSFPQRSEDRNKSVLVTGASGSLGAHLVAFFATQASVEKVICLNREHGSNPFSHQLDALRSRGLMLDQQAIGKLHVLESDTSQRQLGLSTSEYIHLATCVTDIVHNAWPMSLTRSINGFGKQFKTMRNLINLARACRQSGGPQIGFQLVGSIATVGYHIYAQGQSLVPEVAMTAQSSMPIGYADAKLVCEDMLEHTLRQYPNDFRAMTIRLAQIAGSRITGGWNESEHLAQLIKSSKTLNVLPDLPGDLSWCPVNDIAATMGEILLSDVKPYQTYHIENPVRQSWSDMLKVIAGTLEIPSENKIAYEEWVARVRNFTPSLSNTLNPAVRLGTFWTEDFIRMSCGTSAGGIVLDTAHTKEHSAFFRSLGKVSEELVVKYIDAWKKSGLL